MLRALLELGHAGLELVNALVGGVVTAGAVGEAADNGGSVLVHALAEVPQLDGGFRLPLAELPNGRVRAPAELPQLQRRSCLLVGELGDRTVLAGLLTFLAYAMVLTALQTSRVSYVSPAREVGIAFAVLLGIVVLKEPFGRGRLLGAAFILAGLVLIALSP